MTHTPSIGAVVHYHLQCGDNLEPRAAFVQRVSADNHCNLTIFFDGPNDVNCLPVPTDLRYPNWLQSVPYSDYPQSGHWSWPAGEGVVVDEFDTAFTSLESSRALDDGPGAIERRAERRRVALTAVREAAELGRLNDAYTNFPGNETDAQRIERLRLSDAYALETSTESDAQRSDRLALNAAYTRDQLNRGATRNPVPASDSALVHAERKRLREVYAHGPADESPAQRAARFEKGRVLEGLYNDAEVLRSSRFAPGGPPGETDAQRAVRLGNGQPLGNRALDRQPGESDVQWAERVRSGGYDAGVGGYNAGPGLSPYGLPGENDAQRLERLRVGESDAQRLERLRVGGPVVDSNAPLLPGETEAQRVERVAAQGVVDSAQPALNVPRNETSAQRAERLRTGKVEG